MYIKALVLAAGLLAAAPAFAQSDASSGAGSADHAGPIPYSDLAAADAKLNGAGGGAKHMRKHHMARHAKAKAAPAAGAAGAAAPAK